MTVPEKCRLHRGHCEERSDEAIPLQNKKLLNNEQLSIYSLCAFNYFCFILASMLSVA
jgi:hypothetical protein